MKFTIITALAGYSAAVKNRSSQMENDGPDMDSLVQEEQGQQLVQRRSVWRQQFIARYKKYLESKEEEDKEKDSDDEKPVVIDEDNKSWTSSVNIVPTMPVKQQATSSYNSCDGAVKRLINESKMSFKHLDYSETNKFTDKSFEGNSSIWWDFEGKGSYHTNFANNQKRKKLQYKRIAEIDSNASLWGSKDVGELGINQGGLGDCWWMAAASSVAEHGERIKAIFEESELPKDGLMHVKLWSLGQQYHVPIDDKLPLANGRSIAYARKSPNGAWWGPFLEKAAAKFYSRYELLHGGNQYEATYMLTGMPVSVLQHRDHSEDEMWAALEKYDKLKYPMSASCCAKKTHNLVSAHAYTLLGVTRVPSGKYQGTKLVKMRNPWGSERYKGPWDDNSQELKDNASILGHTSNTRDGSFFVPLNVFIEEFGGINVLHYKDWKRDAKPVMIPAKGQPEITVYNPVDQEAVLGTLKRSKRQLRENSCTSVHTSYPVWNDCEVHDSNKNKIDRNAAGVKSTGSPEQSFMMFENLKKGKYTMRNRFGKRHDFPTELGFVTFGAQQFIKIE